ncbi:MAG: flavin reductase [Clostridia bacterium]|nr:flavin reductase [Clostridia bacterium]
MDNAMVKLSYGLFVVTTKYGKIQNGCITNTVMQVTVEPNRITCAINKENYTAELIQKSGVFNVSILSEKVDFTTFKHFGFQTGREVDKFADFEDFEIAENGIAFITKGVNAYLSAKVVDVIDLGSHLLFVADVTDQCVIDKTPSATYQYYFDNIKPKPEAKKTQKTVWRCNICGYEEVAEDLPEDYSCPLCKHPKSDFTKI